MIDFDAHLAPYAAHSSRSRGRRHAEGAAGSRSEFQRDRDRIIHSEPAAPSAAWNTRRRSSSTTRAICSAPG
jgi:hypothetical protein